MHFCEGIYLEDRIWLMHIIILLAHKIQKSFVKTPVFNFSIINQLELNKKYEILVFLCFLTHGN